MLKGFQSLLQIKYQEFNLGSRQQIGERLMKLGWKPTKRKQTKVM